MIPRWPFFNPSPLAEKLVRPTRQTQPTNPSTSAPARIWPQGGLASYRGICVSGSRGEAVPLRRN